MVKTLSTGLACNERQADAINTSHRTNSGIASSGGMDAHT